MRSAEEQQEAARIARDVYVHTCEPAEVLRRAEFLEAFAERMPLRIETDELVVGSMLFNSFRRPRPSDVPADTPWFPGNGGHMVADYGRILQKGIAGLREEVRRMPEGNERRRPFPSAGWISISGPF
jgi:hypothetical protein